MRRIAVLSLCACASLWAQSRSIAFTGARVIPIAGPEIPSGVVVVQNGRILAVGPVGSTPIPNDAQKVDTTGKVIMPGLVDSHSHIGGPEGGDSSAPLQPEARVLDSVNVRAASIRKAQAGGITTSNVMSGSGHLLSGQTLYLKLRDGNTIDDLLIHNDDGSIAGGIKMANGTNSRRATGPFPGTRAKSAALARELFIKAIEYRDKIKQAGSDASKMPARDLRLEALLDVLDGKRTVQFHSHRQDDLMTALRLAKEFNFKIVLHHATDGWMVADEIAKAGAPCSVIVIDSPGGKIETKDLKFETAMVLDKAGVLVGFHTDDPITDSRLFIRSAAIAVRAGMPREKALQAMTINNAKILSLDKHVGSLEPGKDADLVVFSGDPLSVYTHVLETWVEGKKVFDRSKPEDRLYAVGGRGASHDDGEFNWEEEEGN